MPIGRAGDQSPVPEEPEEPVAPLGPGDAASPEVWSPPGDGSLVEVSPDPDPGPWSPDCGSPEPESDVWSPDPWPDDEPSPAWPPKVDVDPEAPSLGSADAVPAPLDPSWPDEGESVADGSFPGPPASASGVAGGGLGAKEG